MSTGEEERYTSLFLNRTTNLDLTANMSNTNLGAYSPDSMMLKIRSLPNSSIALDSKGMPVLKNSDEMAAQFHEIMHHLHNTTTIFGACKFDHTVGLWHAVRNILKNSYQSNGEKALNEAELNKAGRFIYITEKRFSQSHQYKVLGQPFSSLKVNSTDIKSHNIYGAHSLSTIDCSIDVNGNKFKIEVGSQDILENLAWMLENRFLRKIEPNKEPPDAEVVPYRIIEAIAEFESPGISETGIIYCMLASLQTYDPPSALKLALSFAKEVCNNEGNLKTGLEYLVRHRIMECESYIDNLRKSIYQGFPLNNKIARGVKLVWGNIENNINLRKSKPFFELDLIEAIYRNQGELYAAIKLYGGCILLVERPGFDDDFKKDLINVLGGNRRQNDWKVFQAAYKITRGHVKPIDPNTFKTVPTEAIVPSETHKCVFYTSCKHRFRKMNPNICKSEPWRTITMLNPNNFGSCWYAHAALETC